MSRPFMAEMQRNRRGGPFDGKDGKESRAAGSRGGREPEEAAAAPPQITQTIVQVDNAEVLRAVAELHIKLDRVLTVDHEQIQGIQTEIADIAGRIKATKVEMAALRHPLAGEDKFQQASEELGAVVLATERATHTIMASAEELDDIIHELKAQLPDGYQSARVNDMGELIVRIFEACNFQDLTGQRITKVVRALSFIEERVEAMMGLWNKREFEALPLPPSIYKQDGDLDLHGPTEGLSNDAGSFSQSDIDALFD